MKNPDITEMGIINMLATVLGDRFTENKGSPMKREKGMVQRGILASPFARRLSSAECILAEHHVALDLEHERLHEQLEPSKHDCDEFARKDSDIDSKRKIVRGLFRQAFIEEHPQVMGNNVAICEGWSFFNENPEWNTNVPVFEADDIARKFVSRVAAIAKGSRISVHEDDLQVVAQGEELIGTLCDERVQTFYSLVDEVDDSLKKAIPQEIIKGGPPVIGEMTLNEISRLQIKLGIYAMMRKIALSIFWRGVRDEVPDAKNAEHLGIRRCWEVVKIPGPENDEGLLGAIIADVFGSVLAKGAVFPGDDHGLLSKKRF